MVLGKEEIKNIIENCDLELKSANKISFSFDRKWSSSFPSAAGIYAIFDRGALVYIGETANLKERMKDVRRTINHTFRRKLGKKLFVNATIEKGKFNAIIEAKLDEYCQANITFTCKIVNYGRMEIESHLVHKNKGLLNSNSKRNKVDRIYG